MSASSFEESAANLLAVLDTAADSIRRITAAVKAGELSADEAAKDLKEISANLKAAAK
jgi:hypothetical protein